MPKILRAPTTETRKSRISVRLPKKMLADLDDMLAENGISVKQRSKWVSSAIEELAKQQMYEEYILENWIDSGNNVALQFTLTKEAENSLDNMISSLSTSQIGYNEMKSAVVRTAIIQKLIGINI